jgi:recombination associated protein RdgC
MLRAKTEPKTKVLDLSWELKSGEVLVWGTSRGIVEEVQLAVEEQLKVRLVPRVPASFVAPEVLDGLAPTADLFGLESSEVR